MRIQYEEVVAAYEQGLQTQLRGFRPAQAFLETWVHDADPARSILSMVEAAELGGLKDLEIALAPETAEHIDRKRLFETASKLGKAALKAGEGGTLLLHVSMRKGGQRPVQASPKAGKEAPKEAAGRPATPSSTSDALNAADPSRYDAWALERFPDDPAFETPWPEGGKGCGITSSAGGITLSALVNPGNHRILRMAHDAKAKGRPQDRALLTGLCSVSLGATVQDVSEHAVIRLESALRGRERRPVPGVVQPENAAPALGSLLSLVRGLLEDYVRRTGYRIQPNFEEGPLLQASSEWGTSTVSERMQRVRAALPLVCPETGIRGADVKVKALAGPRVTVALPASASKEAQRRYLTLLELDLRAKVDSRLEVFLDDRKDANAKRHATEEALGI
jgi:hypothetical protein